MLFRVCSRNVIINSRKDVWHSFSFYIIIYSDSISMLATASVSFLQQQQHYNLNLKLELKSFAAATKIEGCHFSVEPINRLLVLLNRITLNCSAAAATGIGAASSRWGLSHSRRGVALLVLVVAAVGLVGLVGWGERGGGVCFSNDQ